jgi:hypothetical protein
MTFVVIDAKKRKPTMTPTTWDIKGLSTFLEDDIIAGAELATKLHALGKSKHTGLKPLVDELLSSELYRHHQYAVQIATGQGEVEVLLREVKHPSTTVHELAAYGVAIHATKEQITALIEDGQVIPHVKSLLLRRVKTYRRELVLDLLPTVFKQRGADAAVRLLAYAPLSISDEELVKRVLDYNVVTIVHHTPWIRRRPHAVILFLRKLYDKLASKTDDKEQTARVVFHWNKNVIQSIMGHASKTVVSNLIDLILELTIVPYTNRKFPVEAFTAAIKTIQKGGHLRNHPDKLVQLWQAIASAYTIDSSLKLFAEGSKVFQLLSAAQQEKIFDIYYAKIASKTNRSANGTLLVKLFLLRNANRYENRYGSRHNEEKNKEQFFKNISTKYGKELEDFILENHDWNDDLFNIHPCVGNNVAQRRLDHLKLKQTLNTQEEADHLKFTNPFEDETKRKYFESITSNPSPAIRGEILRAYWQCALYNKSHIKHVAEFTAKRLTNEPSEVKQVLASQIADSMSNLRHLVNGEALPSIEKILLDICFGQKSDPNSSHICHRVLWRMIHSYSKCKDPRQVLQFAVKLLSEFPITGYGGRHRENGDIRSEHVEIVVGAIKNHFEKEEFAKGLSWINNLSKAYQQSQIISIMEKHFAVDGTLHKLLQDPDYITDREDEDVFVHMWNGYLSATKQSERIAVLKNGLKVDPSLILAQSSQTVVFSGSTTSRQREELLGPYLSFDRLDTKSIRSLALQLHSLSTASKDTSQLCMFDTEILIEKRSSIARILNEKHRKRIAAVLSSQLLELVEEPDEKVNMNPFPNAYNTDLILRNAIRLNAVLRVEKSEQQELEEFLSEYEPKDKTLKNHATCSRVYTSTPGEALSKLLEEVTAENVVLVGPAIRRCREFLPAEQYFEAVRPAIIKALEKPVADEEPKEENDVETVTDEEQLEDEEQPSFKIALSFGSSSSCCVRNNV